MTLTVLIVGFGPFPGVARNPTEKLVDALTRLRRPAFNHVHRVALVLPTTYAAIDQLLVPEIERLRPDAVLMFGLAARTRHLRIETRARNSVTPLLPGADRHRPPPAAVAQHGPSLVMARSPLARLLQAVRASRLPVRTSHSAGRYICNLAYWRALTTTPAGCRSPLVQFVHVPKIRFENRPTRVRAPPSLTLNDLIRGGEAILRALLASARRREGAD